VSLKRRYISTRLHGATTQKTAIEEHHVILEMNYVNVYRILVEKPLWKNPFGMILRWILAK
jgi:hypothetical protein